MGSSLCNTVGIARTIDLFLSENIMGKMVTINIARSALISAVLILALVQAVKSDINEELYKKGKRQQRQHLGAIPPRYWQDKTNTGVEKGRKNLFIYLNAYNP